MTEVVLLTDGEKEWTGFVCEVEGVFVSCLFHPDFGVPYPFSLNPFHVVASPTHWMKCPSFKKGIAEDFGTDPIYGTASSLKRKK